MSLFKPGWMSKHEDKALQAVRKVEEQAELLRVVNKSPHSFVRVAAVRELNSITVVTDLARNHFDVKVRLKAIEYVSNDVHLGEIVLQDKDWNVKSAALQRITNQDVLAGIAMSSDSHAINAVVKVGNQSLLEHIALNCKSELVRDAAIRSLMKGPVLENIAYKHSSEEAREAARKRIEELEQ